MPAIFRTEQHGVSAAPQDVQGVARTIAFYRRAVRLLCTLIMTHWPEIQAQDAIKRQGFIEGLFHATRERPIVRYAVIDRALGKMPSYLRRAAIEAAYGAVSSYLSNYSNWLDQAIGPDRKKGQRPRGSRPPRLGIANVNPPLYGGNMIRQPEQARWPWPKANRTHLLKAVEIKLLGADGEWAFSATLRLKGKPKRLPINGEMSESPTLLLCGSKVKLACPVKFSPPKWLQNKHIKRILALDVGINTHATGVILARDGTVIARKFFHGARHQDRREDLLTCIARKQAQTGKLLGKPGKGFCRTLFRRLKGVSLQLARELASEIMAFARKHGVKALVLERLKGWKPKANAGQGPRLRQRFHLFHHRLMAKYLGFAAGEEGIRMLEVSPAGTSAWAYDGSGKVTRDAKNAANATFTTGKRYNADLNAAYNIGARGLAMVLGIGHAKFKAGRSPAVSERMPLVLADVWRLFRDGTVVGAAHKRSALRDIGGSIPPAI